MTTFPHRLFLLLSSAAALAACTTAPESHTNQAAFPPETRRLARSPAPTIPPPNTPAGESPLEQVAQFSGPMPTGIAISPTGSAASDDARIFLSFPRWTDPLRFTVAELKDGKLEPFPSGEFNNFSKATANSTLVSVQSVVLDENKRLWLLNSGNINMGENLTGGPKLVAVRLSDNHIDQIIRFPADVAKPDSYLNDVRFDMPGVFSPGGFAYISDSSSKGDNAIIVVDLTTGHSWRKLQGDPSVLPEPNFSPVIDGQPLLIRQPGQSPKPLSTGVDGIALSTDGRTLYYRPLAGHHLYSIDTTLLRHENVPPDQVSAGVHDLGDLGFASDGLLIDGRGTLYLTDYEHHAIHSGDPATANAHFPILVSDPRLIWPDSLAISPDQFLYITVNQLDRQPRFHNGQDQRTPPYALFRLHIPAGPNIVQDRP